MYGLKRWLTCLALGGAVLLAGCGGSDGGGNGGGGGGGGNGGGGDKPPVAMTLSGSVTVLGNQTTPAQAGSGATVRVLKTDQSELAQATADADGYFTVGTLPTNTDLLVAVTRDGAVDQVMTLQAGNVTEGMAVTINLLPRTDVTATRQNLAQGAAYTGSAGSQIVIAPGSFVDADGNVATDTMQVSITPLNIVTQPQGFPGSNRVTDSNGNPAIMVSGGMADFSFSENGKKLRLKPGATATIRIPLYVEKDPAGAALTEGDTVPMWTMDSATGQWTQEGSGKVVASSASPTGYAVEAEVSHFSWWNIDWAVPGRWVMLEVHGVDDGVYVGLRLDQYLPNGPRTAAAGPSSITGKPNRFPIFVGWGFNMTIELYGFKRNGTPYITNGKYFSWSEIERSNMTDKPLSINAVSTTPVIVVRPRSNDEVKIHPKGGWNDSVYFWGDFINMPKRIIKHWRINASTPKCNSQGTIGSDWGTSDFGIYVAPPNEDVPAGGCKVAISAYDNGLSVTSEPTIIEILKPQATGGIFITGLYGDSTVTTNFTEQMLLWYGSPEARDMYATFRTPFPEKSLVLANGQFNGTSLLPQGHDYPIKATLDEMGLMPVAVKWSIRCLKQTGVICPDDKSPTVEFDAQGNYYIRHPGKPADYVRALYELRAVSQSNSLVEGSVIFFIQGGMNIPS